MSTQVFFRRKDKNIIPFYQIISNKIVLFCQISDFEQFFDYL